MKDQLLIKEYRETFSPDLIGELYKKYGHLVLGVCLKYLKDTSESQDAVMAIFEKLLEKLKYHEVEYFKTWLYSFSKNYCIDVLRKKERKAKQFRVFSTWEKNNHSFIENSLFCLLYENENMHLDVVAEALSALNSHQRDCLEKFYFQSMTYAEISDSTSYSYKEVKTHLQNGKRNLKKTILEKMSSKTVVNEK